MPPFRSPDDGGSPVDDDAITLALGRVIIAAAWADGTIQTEEVECLKDLLFQMPELCQRNWDVLDELMQEPVTPEQREQFVAELKAVLQTSEERDYALYALDTLINADGIVTAEESRIAEEMKNAIASLNLESMRTLLTNPLERRHVIMHDRDGQIPDPAPFIRESVRVRLRESADIDPALATNDRLNLAAALIARMLPPHLSRSDEGRRVLANAIRRDWTGTPEESHYIAWVAGIDVIARLDILRLCRRFYENSDTRSRISLVNLLFTAAQFDGSLTQTEYQTILGISSCIRLGPIHFENAFADSARWRARIQAGEMWDSGRANHI